MTDDRIKLGQDHSVHTSTFAHPTRPGSPGRKVPQAAIKLGELIDGFVPDEGFADKDDLVRSVDGDEFGERSHEGFVVLHPTGGVDEDNVKGVLGG